MLEKNWLAYLLIAVIALQSVAAVADIHQVHQAEIDHRDASSLALDFDEDQVSTESIVLGIAFTGEPADDDRVPVECQHCCHCHSVKLHYFPPLDVLSRGSSNAKDTTPFLVSTPTGQPTPLLRPPIV